jgi:tRNA threonylcarbamoyl adenosine modification protein YeaZ
MKAFYIDASNQPTILALFDQGKVVDSKAIQVGPLAKDDIFLHIDELLKDVALSYVVLGIGPGSYTGMRVASTIASTLAYALKIPLITVTSMDSYVYSEPYIVVFDAKRDKIYLGEVGKEPRVAEISELKNYGDFFLVTPHLERLEGLFCGKWILGESNLEHIAEISKIKYDKKTFTDPKNVELLYLQNPYKLS